VNRSVQINEKTLHNTTQNTQLSLVQRCGTHWQNIYTTYGTAGFSRLLITFLFLTVLMPLLRNAVH